MTRPDYSTCYHAPSDQARKRWPWSDLTHAPSRSPLGGRAAGLLRNPAPAARIGTRGQSRRPVEPSKRDCAAHAATSATLFHRCALCCTPAACSSVATTFRSILASRLLAIARAAIPRTLSSVAAGGRMAVVLVTTQRSSWDYGASNPGRDRVRLVREWLQERQPRSKPGAARSGFFFEVATSAQKGGSP